MILQLTAMIHAFVSLREINKSMDSFMSVLSRRAQFHQSSRIPRVERKRKLRRERERERETYPFGSLDDVCITGTETDEDVIPTGPMPKNKENSKRKKQMEDEGDEDYRKRRDRNNQAVKRSRVKSKLRTQQTLERVNQLKTENELLEEKIKMLTKELGFLKDLFIAHAGGSGQHSMNIQDLDLNSLLAEEKSTEESSVVKTSVIRSTSKL
ncbi:PREDICTED: CCAAT/enhancer-binding protein gamma isoform X2 [Trachymyrmex septentrionalis]|uniref:CCAAT/enhancer-binding protein gamma isoform X2 n=1 Tax=Trachymyrmex septentrionalis TaxID=34720 RepID=UPI00084EFF2D|nr:PREDICTED: CCAAT/enhancer-binding protein gamma isoform X2 [Trachymyrmex septentrionalis]